MKRNSSEGRQHYVPRFYLQHFGFVPPAKSKASRIFVRDQDAGTTFVASVKDIAAEVGFYDATNDDGTPFSADPPLTALENIVAPAMRRLLADSSPPLEARLGDMVSPFKLLTEDDQWALALFCATMMARVPAFRAQIRDIRATIFSQAHTLQERFSPDNPKAIEHLRPDENRIVRETGMVAIEDAKGLANILLHRIWVVSTPPVGEHFITSDNPVIRVFSEHSVETERLVPLSPTLLLGFLPCETSAVPLVPKYLLHEVTSQDVVWHNWRQSDQATRFVFAHDAEDFESILTGGPPLGK